MTIRLAFFTSSTILFSCLLLHFAPMESSAFPILSPRNPDFETFSFIDHGSFVGKGPYFFYSLYPVRFPLGNLSGIFAMDVENSRYFYQIIPAAGNFSGVGQYGYSNGTYFTESDNKCYFTPVNFSQYLYVYSAVLGRSEGVFTKSYGGMVNDPGSCKTQFAVSFLKRNDGVLLQYNADSFINSNFSGCAPAHFASTLTFNTWEWGTPHSSYFTLPTSCYAPLDYCSHYSPPGCDIVTPL